jgi:hypothetical protein
MPPASLSNIVARYRLAAYRAGCWTVIAHMRLNGLRLHHHDDVVDDPRTLDS